MTLRAAGKRVVERILRQALADPNRMQGRVLILAYHNVVPDQFKDLGDRSLHLPLSAFQAQLDLLQTHFEICALSDLLSPGNVNGGPRIGLTFDDAYRGAVELALPELKRRGLSGTLFVAPGLLGSDRFWWDELASPGTGLSAELREAALERHAGRRDPILAALGQQRSVALPEYYSCVREEELLARADGKWLTLGSHTWSHPNLSRLAEPELTDELSRPLTWLGNLPVHSVPVLAYPYGLTSATVEAAAARAGYRAALRVEGGWVNRENASAWAMPRYNVPAGLSADGFMLRLSGWLTT